MQLIKEIATYLGENGIGTLGTNLFYGTLPDIDSTFSVLIRDTGGLRPDDYITDIKSPTFQVFIRSKTYDTGKIKLNSVRSLLHTIVNQTLIDSGIYYRRVRALAEGGHLGKNDAGHHEFSINFEANIIE